MQRHLAFGRRQFRPVADAAEMAAIAQSDHCNAALGRLGGSGLAGELTHHLTEAAIAVDDRYGVAFENNRRSLIRSQPTAAHPFEILADPDDPVRIVPHQVGVDEPPRDHRRFVRVATAATHDRRHQIGKLRRGNGPHDQ